MMKSSIVTALYYVDQKYTLRAGRGGANRGDYWIRQHNKKNSLKLMLLLQDGEQLQKENGRGRRATNIPLVAKKCQGGLQSARSEEVNKFCV